MTYRDRRLRKAERLREWADKRDVKAEADRAASDAVTSQIPFGQPILSGHHSERRHRNALKRADKAMTRSVESKRKAAEFRSRAGNIEAAAERAVYSDDEDAAEKLAERIASLEDDRRRIKAYNASARKNSPDMSLLTDELKVELAKCANAGAAFIGDKGQFPPFVLANVGGRINRARKRLAAL